MTFLREKLPRGDHVSLHAGRAASAGVSAHPGARGQHPLEPGTWPRAADLRHQQVRRGARSGHRHLVFGPEGLSPRSRRERTGARTSSTGSTTAAGPQGAPSRSMRRPPTRARRSGPRSSTTSACISTGTPCTGGTTRRNRASANQNVWADSITFDNRRQPNRSPGRRGIHPWRRRADLSGRRAAASGSGSRCPGRSPRSNWRTSGAACRTTST